MHSVKFYYVKEEFLLDHLFFIDTKTKEGRELSNKHSERVYNFGVRLSGNTLRFDHLVKSPNHR